MKTSPYEIATRMAHTKHTSNERSGMSKNANKHTVSPVVRSASRTLSSNTMPRVPARLHIYR